MEFRERFHGEARVSDEVRLRHRRRRLVSRQGHHRRVARPAAEGARPQGAGPEVRPVHQRRPGHDEPVPARRGVRDRGRRRDRSRHRPLRALHRREPLARREPHRRRRLGPRAAQGAQGRVPRLDRAGDPAHHERDQGAHPLGRRGDRHRRRDHGDRRHGRRHRVAAVPRGDPPVPARGRARERRLPPRHARAVHRHRRRAEDEADAALGQRAAPHRYPPRRPRLPLDRAAAARHPRQDRALRRRRRRRGHLERRRPRRLPRAARPARAGPRRARLPQARPRRARAGPHRLDRAERADQGDAASRSRSRSSAST